MVEAFLASPLPPRNLNLSEDAPLFFFHQRKTAGSSMRKAIVEAAKAANLSYFVSCHDGVPCDLYHVGTNFSAIYAGHFVWGEQRELSRRSVFDPATGTWHNPRHNASCLTMFRDPVSRLESCYYFRFVQVGPWQASPDLCALACTAATPACYMACLQAPPAHLPCFCMSPACPRVWSASSCCTDASFL